MEETPLESTPSFSAPTKRKINKRFIYVIIAVVVLIVLFLGFNFLTADNTQDSNEPTIISPTDFPTDTPEPTIDEQLSPTDTPTPTTTKTPTPQPTLDPVDETTGLDRSDITVTVQNGSGEAGVAGKASDILKHLGYGISGTGNADNFNYEGVTIKVKSSQSKYLNLLKSDLSEDYTVSASSSDLDNSFSSDALVIIGK